MNRRLAFDPARCLACKSCELACSVVHSRAGELEGALAESPPPRRRVALAMVAGVLEAQRCEQCDDPLCVFACKSGGLHRAPGGALVFEEERCLGCSMCLMVCPSGVRPDPARHRVVRCDVCGALAVPACVTACPTKALCSEEGRKAATDTLTNNPPAFLHSLEEYKGHVVVVGSSAAGIGACEAARRHAPSCKITLVTPDADTSLSRPLLSYQLAGRLGAFGPRWRPPGYLEELGVTVRRARASGLDAAAHRLSLDDGSAVSFDRLVIATGARPTMPGLPGVELEGVLGLRELEDLTRIEARLARARSALVLGGGNVGLQVCEALTARGLAVTVVVASPHLLSQMVDAEAGRRVGELFREHGVTVRTGRDVRALHGDRQVERAELDNGESVPADLVVIGKGIQANVEWLKGSGLRLERGVLVDLCSRASAPDIFAAGDCAESEDPLTGRPALSGIWPVAYEMGWSAGCTAVGLPRESAGALRMNASSFFDVPIISLGEVRPERLAGSEPRLLVDGPRVYRKLVVKDRRLVGALLYGDITGAGRLYRWYREGTPIDV
jgi:nitrite reductase (NADH) large subunit